MSLTGSSGFECDMAFKENFSWPHNEPSIGRIMAAAMLMLRLGRRWR